MFAPFNQLPQPSLVKTSLEKLSLSPCFLWTSLWLFTIVFEVFTLGSSSESVEWDENLAATTSETKMPETLSTLGSFPCNSSQSVE